MVTSSSVRGVKPYIYTYIYIYGDPMGIKKPWFSGR
jgi:hypothetical protein